jgi:hypothetical protein
MPEALSYAPGKMGWGPEGQDIQTVRAFEKVFGDRMIKASPELFEIKDERPLRPAVQEAWDKLQVAAGRLGKGSKDMSLLGYLAFKRRLKWFPQGIGSCVYSNTFRGIVDRMIYEIGLRGDPEEYFGRDEHGQHSIAPHCVQYGFARQIGNMRGSDGLYASVMARSLAAGQIMCSTPKLIELMEAEGASAPSNFPEPRSNALYRKIGDWAFNDALRPYLTCPVTEIPAVKDFETHQKLAEMGKPIFQCSMIAIHKKSKHKDGFWIHEKDPNNAWAHNMLFKGYFFDSTGTRWNRLSNLSWLNDPNPEAVAAVPAETVPTWDDEEEGYLYNISDEELKSWYTKGLVDSYAIGEIDLPDSAVPQV